MCLDHQILLGCLIERSFNLMNERIRVTLDLLLDCLSFGARLPNTVRLKQMLDDAAFAFLVLTAEDERADGKVQARMNVVHEAGLSRVA
jgi:predicted nucleotide-binding protein with TIR-like domain